MRHSLEDLLEDHHGAWLVSLALLSPVFLLYLAHIALQPAWIWPSGFLHYDHVALLAEAREHFDGGFSWLRALPFSDSASSPRLYAEPLSLLLGVAQATSGLGPGAVNAAAGAILAFVCMRTALALYGRLVGFTTPGRRLGLLLFIWGGGVFTLAGAALALSGGGLAALRSVEPGDGWIGLNLGRALLSPEQAFLHAIFLLTLLCLVQRRFLAAALLCLLAAVSDEVTGLQLLAVVFAWGLLERGFLGDRSLPRWFLVVAGGLLLAHCGHRFALLPLLSAEHPAAAAPSETLTLILLLCGYGLVAAFSIFRLRNRIHAAPLLGQAAGRLLLVWLLISFALANHEFLMAPREPLRFTRGYLWMPLFLIGAPVLAALLDRLWSARGRWRWPAPCAVALLVALFLLDNAAFLALEIRGLAAGAPRPEQLTRVERQLLAALDDPRFEGNMVATSRRPIGYMATVYTPLRAWYSHRQQTPSAALRRQRLVAFAERDILPAEWLWDDVVVVLQATPIEAGRLPWLRYGMTVEDAPGRYVFVISLGR